MFPSLFSLGQPASLFQVWFVVYLYALPILLWTAWTTLAFLDLGEARDSAVGWAVAILVVPLVGAGLYLLTRAESFTATSRRAMVLAGLVIWVVPLAVGIWLGGGPLGPKALTQ
jgi:hypothetical protein